MRSELRITGYNWKLTLTIGAFLTILIIILSVIYRFEIGLILLTVAGTVAAVGVLFVTAGTLRLVYKIKMNGLDLEQKRQEVRLATYQADRAKLEAYVLNYPKTQRLVTLPDSNVRVIEALADSGQLMLTESTTQVDLLAALDSVQRCLIVGASDSGKTTLLQWLVSRRLNTSRVIVIDPHAYPGKWPDSADLVGSGRDYQAIDKALTALVQLMTKRYDEIGRGAVAEMAHGRVTVLIDEWRAIVYALGKPASEAIKTLLVESRKAAFSVFVATHSDRAKPLGLEGEYDLKDGFDVVRLSIVDGQRQATIDHGNGETPAVLPGPYQGRAPQVLEHRPGPEPLDLEPEPSPVEAHVLELLGRDESYRTISQTVWGQHGEFYNDKIDDIKRRFGEK